MPDWLPEGNVSLPTDSELRSAEKFCSILFNASGTKSSPFPEGTKPMPGDDLDRLTQKINIMLYG